jgi:hypothetical protein
MSDTDNIVAAIVRSSERIDQDSSDSRSPSPIPKPYTEAHEPGKRVIHLATALSFVIIMFFIYLF